MESQFPRTNVCGISLPRMLIGTNWFCGFSHVSPAADSLIKQRNSGAENIADIIEVYLNAGVNALMCVFEYFPIILEAVKIAEDRTGMKMILIDTPGINVDNNENARREAENTIKKSKRNGVTFCMPHHMAVEQLVNKNKCSIDRLPDYLEMIRDNGMIPGLSAHMPELIEYSDLNEYDVQTYIQIFNCLGFLMQKEVEIIHKVIWNAKKPVMTIKPMAAGRVSPFVGLTFSWHTIRPCDMVTVGTLTSEEAAEDIEISLAAFENRPPEVEKRASPSDHS